MKQIFGRCLTIQTVNRKEKHASQAQGSEDKRDDGLKE